MRIMELFVSFVPLLVIPLIQDSTARPTSFWSGFLNPTTESTPVAIVEDIGYGSLYNNLNTGDVTGPMGNGNGPQHDILVGISGSKRPSYWSNMPNTHGIQGSTGYSYDQRHNATVVGVIGPGHGSDLSNNENSKGVQGLVGDGNPSQHDIVVGVTGIGYGGNVRNNTNSGGVQGPIGDNNGPQYNIKVGVNV